MNFAKKKHKQKKVLRKAQKQMLQYVRRNLEQAKGCREGLRKKGEIVSWRI